MGIFYNSDSRFSVIYPNEVLAKTILRDYIDFSLSCFPVNLVNNYLRVDSPYFKDLNKSTFRNLHSDLSPEYDFKIFPNRSNHFELLVGEGPSAYYKKKRALERELFRLDM